jgi:hypothetical protein
LTTLSKARRSVGILGWFVTLGLILYEVRNTEHYDAARQRLECLEEMLGFPATQSATKEGAPGGAYQERPRRNYRFLGIRIVHDRALGIIYGATLAGWTLLALDGLGTLGEIEWSVYLNPGIIAVGVGALVWDRVLGPRQGDQTAEDCTAAAPEGVTNPSIVALAEAGGGPDFFSSSRFLKTPMDSLPLPAPAEKGGRGEPSLRIAQVQDDHQSVSKLGV